MQPWHHLCHTRGTGSRIVEDDTRTRATAIVTAMTEAGVTNAATAEELMPLVYD